MNHQTHGVQCAEAKWAVVIDDQLYPMPRRIMPLEQILAQAGLPCTQPIVRDRNSPYDEFIQPEATVDLGEGNVLRTASKPPEGACGAAAPKLAFVLDDSFEVTINPNQTLESLLGLFSLGSDCELVRDYESPEDRGIAPGENVQFHDGPVFSKRQKKGVSIIVNGRQRTVTESELTFSDIVALGFDAPPTGENVCYTVTFRRGDCSKPEGTIIEGESIKIKEGMIINVTATDKS